MFRRVLAMDVLFLPTSFWINAGGAAQEATPTGESEVVVLAPDNSYGGRTRAEWYMQ